MVAFNTAAAKGNNSGVNMAIFDIVAECGSFFGENVKTLTLILPPAFSKSNLSPLLL